jgi:hypothetical protein
VPDDKAVVKVRVIVVVAPLVRLIGVPGADDPPLKAESGFPLTKISVIVASDNPVFFTFIITVLESEVYALVISNFSKEVAIVVVNVLVEVTVTVLVVVNVLVEVTVNV